MTNNMILQCIVGLLYIYLTCSGEVDDGSLKQAEEEDTAVFVLYKWYVMNKSK